MRYSFRLAELLGHVPDPRKRPGTIKAIVDYTGLDRHQVAALLKNEVKYIPLKALSRICDYLIEHGHASADQLPGALFAVEPENFWELLARRRRLEMCLGIRRDPDDPTSPDEVPEVSYVVASDSVLLGEILNGVTTLGGTASFRGGESQAILPHPEHLKQSVVWSPGQASPEEVSERADTVYREFNDFCGDKALVSIGSTKSNPVVEMTISQVFGCEPFTSQDDVKDSRDRACWFFTLTACLRATSKWRLADSLVARPASSLEPLPLGRRAFGRPFTMIRGFRWGASLSNSLRLQKKMWGICYARIWSPKQRSFGCPVK